MGSRLSARKDQPIQTPKRFDVSQSTPKRHSVFQSVPSIQVHDPVWRNDPRPSRRVGIIGRFRRIRRAILPIGIAHTVRIIGIIVQVAQVGSIRSINLRGTGKDSWWRPGKRQGVSWETSLTGGRMVFIHVERILSCFLLSLFLGIMPMSRMHRECGNSGIFRPGRGLQTVCSVSYQASGKVRVSFWVPYGCRFR